MLSPLVGGKIYNLMDVKTYKIWYSPNNSGIHEGAEVVLLEDYEALQAKVESAAPQKWIEELEKALSDLLRAYDQLIPGIPHIAVQDYKLMNDAPMEARRLLGLTGVLLE